MVNLAIDDALFQQLQNLAERQKRPVQEIVEEVLEDYLASAYDENSDPFLLIAKAAEEAGLSSGRDDIAERSRELLDTEYPDDLMRRVRGDDGSK